MRMKSDLKDLNPLAPSLLSLDNGGKLMIPIWGKFFREALLCSLGLGLLFSPFELLATQHSSGNTLDIPLFNNSNSNKISLNLFNENLELTFKYLKDLNTQIRNILDKIKDTKSFQNKKDLTNEKKRLLNEHQELLNQIKNSLAKIDALGRDSIDSKDLPNLDKLRAELKEDLEQHEVKTELQNKVSSIIHKIEETQIKEKTLSIEELKELQKEIIELRKGILNHVESNEKIGDTLVEAYKEALDTLSSLEKDLKNSQFNQTNNNFLSDSTTQNSLTDSDIENHFPQQNTKNNNKESFHKPNTTISYPPPSSLPNIYEGNSSSQENESFRKENDFRLPENLIQTPSQQNSTEGIPSTSSEPEILTNSSALPKKPFPLTRFENSPIKISNYPKLPDSIFKLKNSPKTNLNNNANSVSPYLELQTPNIVNESSLPPQNPTTKQEGPTNSEPAYRSQNLSLKRSPVAYNTNSNNSATTPTNSPLKAEIAPSTVNINQMSDSNSNSNTINYTFNNDGTFSPITSLSNDNNPQRGLVSLSSSPSETSELKIADSEGVRPGFETLALPPLEIIINQVLEEQVNQSTKPSDVSELLAPRIKQPSPNKSKGIKKTLTIPPPQKGPDNNQNNLIGKMLAWLRIK